jgi:hypothetical protein
MRLVALLFSCMAIVAAGCKDGSKQSNTPTANTAPPKPPASRPATEPASRPAVRADNWRPQIPPSLDQNIPPVERVRAAKQAYSQELLLLRRYHWSQTAPLAVLAAAAKVFEGRATLDGRSDPKASVDFYGLSPMHVKLLVGNPRGKQVVESDEIWTYHYSAQGKSVTRSLRFHDGKVVPDPDMVVGL